MFPMKVGNESSEAMRLPSPVQSHGTSQHRALAGTAARSHVSNLGWSAATPEDVPRLPTAAAAQPHCHCLAFHAPRIHTVTSVLLHTMRSALCGCSAAEEQWRGTSAGVAALHLRLFKWGCSAALFCAWLQQSRHRAMVAPLRALAALWLQLPTLLGNIAYDIRR